MRSIILYLLCIILGWYLGNSLSQAYISGKYSEAIGPILIVLLWITVILEFHNIISKWLK